jgi:hypothetical protein
MVFQQTQPTPDQIKFVVPGSNGNNAAILFTFSSLDGGKSTQVIAELDIPALVVTINGQRKVLSAKRVASSLRKSLRKYDRRGDAKALSTDMSLMLFALAIGTNDSFRDRAMALRESPSTSVAGMFDEDDAMDAENAPDDMAVNDNEPPALDPPANEPEDQVAENTAERSGERESENEPEVAE